MVLKQSSKMEEATKVLEGAYEKVSESPFPLDLKVLELDEEQREWITAIADACESQKAVTTALITCLVKKITEPSQDVRLHRKEFEGGYSARVFDTKYVTPFLKKRFPRIAMKESGWLSRSIEQPHPFTLDFPGKIRDARVKCCFLEILNDIEENDADAERYLLALFTLLLQKFTEIRSILEGVIFPKKMQIDSIIECLRSHFFHKYGSAGASKLPVLAVYSLYQLMMEDITRYRNKRLKSLRSYESPDLHAKAIGDVEVVDETGEYFEVVEIKHNIPISESIINDSYKKFRKTAVSRYYLLTTAEPYIREEEGEGEETRVENLKQRIKNEHGCEVIVNGIIPSIKYYLRLVKTPSQFMETYTNNLKEDKEVKEEHLRVWLGVIEKI
ncbi:DNA methyltransferase [ANME-1 cluster archaeon ex4572_4]|nr:MAG: DNA methyltransferase [ANME-1 cluster archaeon ex4572_4]